MADKRIRINLDVTANGADKAAADIRRVGQAAKEASASVGTATTFYADVNRQMVNQMNTQAAPGSDVYRGMAQARYEREIATQQRMRRNMYQIDNGVFPEQETGKFRDEMRRQREAESQAQLDGLKKQLMEEDRLAKERQRTMEKEIKTARDQERAHTRLLTQASGVTMALSSVAGGLLEVDEKARKAFSALQGAGLGFEIVGGITGGKAGQTMIMAGMAAQIAATVGTAIAAGVEAYSNAQTAKQDEANKKPAWQDFEEKSKAAYDKAAYWRSEAVKYGNSWQPWMQHYAVGAAEAADIKEREGSKYGRMAKDEKSWYDATNLYGPAREGAARAKAPFLTPAEQARNDANELRKQADAVGEAAKKMRELEPGSSKKSEIEQMAKRLDAERNDLLKRAVDRLDNIDNSTKTWAEFGMESVGAGRIGSRPVTLGEIGAVFQHNPSYSLNFINQPGMTADGVVRLLKSAGFIQM